MFVSKISEATPLRSRRSAFRATLSLGLTLAFFLGSSTALAARDSDTEISLWWTQSTDNFDAQANIHYDVYVNGVLEDVLFGSGGRSIVYGQQGQNTIEVIASDTAGNESPPATIMVFF